MHLPSLILIKACVFTSVLAFLQVLKKPAGVFMYKNILIPVALDGKRDTEDQYSAAKAVSGEASRFTVLHVMEQIPRYIEAQIPEDIRASALNEVKMELKQAATSLKGASSVLLSGHAGRSIVDYANGHDIDCIVVASHLRVVSDVFLGSTAAWIVRHSKCSVHVLR